MTEDILGEPTVVLDIPIACNRSSTDFLITSPLLTDYRPRRELSAAGL